MTNVFPICKVAGPSIVNMYDFLKFVLLTLKGKRSLLTPNLSFTRHSVLLQNVHLFIQQTWFYHVHCARYTARWTRGYLKNSSWPLRIYCLVNSTGMFGDKATSGVADVEAKRENSLRSERTAVNEKSHSGPASLSGLYSQGTASENVIREICASYKGDHSLGLDDSRLLRFWDGRVDCCCLWGVVTTRYKVRHQEFFSSFYDSLPTISKFLWFWPLRCCLPGEGSLRLSVTLKDFLFLSQFGLLDFVVRVTARLWTAQAQPALFFKIL